MSPRRAKLWERSTGDVLVLIITLTICAGVASVGLSVIVLSFVYPDRDNAVAVRFVTSVVSTLIGLLAGFLAGRTDDAMRKVRDEEDQTRAGPDNR